MEIKVVIIDCYRLIISIQSITVDMTLSIDNDLSISFAMSDFIDWSGRLQLLFSIEGWRNKAGTKNQEFKLARLGF